MGQKHSTDIIGNLDLTGMVNTSKNIELTINNVKYQVPKDIYPQMTLNYFIRNIAKLKGTKFMCLEGGCGVCIVSAAVKDRTFSVNSCLVPIFICNGWQITTIEGIGGKRDGYNTLQSTLAEMNGSQCGYCSPAMIMNMYSLVEQRKLTTKEIENSFGSNICRCTGYRPILNAFQSFASDSKNTESPISFADIEDLHKSILSRKKCEFSKIDDGDFEKIDPDEQKPLHLHLKGAEFFKVFNVTQIFSLFAVYPDSSYILNGGNTGNGVYRMGKKDLYIDINDVDELHRIVKTDTSLLFGGGVTLETAKENLNKYSKDPGFEHLRHLADHVDLIGHVAMRNIGTLAGNLMLKNEHRDFPSDLFLILETSGAQIHILESPPQKIISSLMTFLTMDMNHKLIYSIVIPKLEPTSLFTSYKIMPRAQNAHAHVNAGFLFNLDEETKVLERPNIIYGGINPNFLHALKTEEFLEGKILLDKKVLAKALKTLNSELNPDYVLPDPTPAFRKKLAIGLFYKFILSLKPDKVETRLRSGGTILQRNISSGKDDYDTNRSLWPVNKPIQKLEALIQTAGEAEYVNDIAERNNELFSIFALAERVGKIKEIDYSEALKCDGFVAFYTAKDVPGKNTFIDSSKPMIAIINDEELFADKDVIYAGQPYGILVATSQYEAQDAVKKVKLIYVKGPQKRPLLTVRDVLSSNDKTRFMESVNEPATAPRGQDVKHVIKDTFESGSQYHYTLEPQCCISVPIEDGFDVFVPTQWIDLIQHNIAVCMGIKENSINIVVRRVGGSYGAKCSRPAIIACATTLAASKLGRPVRFNMTVEQMMQCIGKRAPSYQEYEIGVNDLGKIQYLKTDYWSNQGTSFNDALNFFAVDLQKSCYDNSTWDITATSVITDLSSNTFTRCPATAEGSAIVENMMEHIAKVTKRDPIDVRLENVTSDDKEFVKIVIDEIAKTSDYRNRQKEIEIFNRENRWKKKGISLVLMKYKLFRQGPYHAMISVYGRDGTVSITHGGIEMGQGINTKVAQVAAYTLGIDIDLISIKPTNNLTAPNCGPSVASFTSDACCSATKTACEILLKRLEPIKNSLSNPSWKEIVLEAITKEIDLNASHAYCKETDIPKLYYVYGATVASVEIDLLTGQHIIDRVDILEDTGTSLSPEIDIGQVQGSFVMGIGLWTSEELIYNEKTGALTNFRTWNYKPPGAKDIPVDFRISFLRNRPNPVGILRSKATGEPSLCMTFAIPIALRNALNSARADAGNTDDWYELNGPVTVEKTLLTSLTKIEDMQL